MRRTFPLKKSTLPTVTIFVIYANVTTNRTHTSFLHCLVPNVPMQMPTCSIFSYAADTHTFEMSYLNDSH